MADINGVLQTLSAPAIAVAKAPQLLAQSQTGLMNRALGSPERAAAIQQRRQQIQQYREQRQAGLLQQLMGQFTQTPLRPGQQPLQQRPVAPRPDPRLNPQQQLAWPVQGPPGMPNSHARQPTPQPAPTPQSTAMFPSDMANANNIGQTMGNRTNMMNRAMQHTMQNQPEQINPVTAPFQLPGRAIDAAAGWINGG